MDYTKFPPIFNLSQAEDEAQNSFNDSVLSFARIMFLTLKYEYGVTLLEDNHTGYFREKNMQGNLLVQFKTGDTPGSKMLECQVNVSGVLHFNLLHLEDRGYTSGYAWEITHEEPLNNERYQAEDYWQHPEAFAEYLPKIAEVLKK